MMVSAIPEVRIIEMFFDLLKSSVESFFGLLMVICIAYAISQLANAWEYHTEIKKLIIEREKEESDFLE